MKMKRRLAVSKKLLIKSGDKLIEMPIETVKSILAEIGFSGKLLVNATGGVFKEAKKLAKSGVVHTVDFEKAIVRAVNNTNSIATASTKKLAKRLLK